MLLALHLVLTATTTTTTTTGNQAAAAVGRLRESVDMLVVVSNDRLLQIIPPGVYS